MKKFYTINAKTKTEIKEFKSFQDAMNALKDYENNDLYKVKVVTLPDEIPTNLKTLNEIEQQYGRKLVEEKIWDESDYDYVKDYEFRDKLEGSALYNSDSDAINYFSIELHETDKSKKWYITECDVTEYEKITSYYEIDDELEDIVDSDYETLGYELTSVRVYPR